MYPSALVVISALSVWSLSTAAAPVPYARGLSVRALVDDSDIYARMVDDGLLEERDGEGLETPSFETPSPEASSLAAPTAEVEQTKPHHKHHRHHHHHHHYSVDSLNKYLFSHGHHHHHHHHHKTSQGPVTAPAAEPAAPAPAPEAAQVPPPAGAEPPTQAAPAAVAPPAAEAPAPAAAAAPPADAPPVMRRAFWWDDFEDLD